MRPLSEKKVPVGRRNRTDEIHPSVNLKEQGEERLFFRNMDQLARQLNQLVAEWEKWKETEKYRLVQFGFKYERISVRHTENAKASPDSCYIRCARYNDRIVVPISDVLAFLPYIFGRRLSDEECDIAATTLARCSFREVRKKVYEKIFGVHVEQTILFLLEDLQNVTTKVIAEIGRVLE
ncbi:hypothetical protein B0T21DRAFT_416545 [Apiosordaria backusii]|uniref:Uncharacterized protein n=1 Tax=Apiosordaria backusii TaxID=314023 RepID=A0AA40DK15_9PEZI|nr:hypothetical protein B0T21DRAFT_416545 [Apiosordaria backusii]